MEPSVPADLRQSPEPLCQARAQMPPAHLLFRLRGWHGQSHVGSVLIILVTMWTNLRPMPKTKGPSCCLTWSNASFAGSDRTTFSEVISPPEAWPSGAFRFSPEPKGRGTHFSLKPLSGARVPLSPIPQSSQNWSPLSILPSAPSTLASFCSSSGLAIHLEKLLPLFPLDTYCGHRQHKICRQLGRWVDEGVLALNPFIMAIDTAPACETGPGHGRPTSWHPHGPVIGDDWMILTSLCPWGWGMLLPAWTMTEVRK
jgi:hypothetical protein